MNTKTSFFLAVVLVACALGDSSGRLSYHELKHEPVVTNTPWVFSVIPTEELNSSPDPHVTHFPYSYSFCVPLQRVPSGEYTARLNLTFKDVTNEIVIDFDFSRAFDFVSKDPVSFLSIPLHYHSKDVNGWSTSKGFSQPLSGKIFSETPVTKVSLEADGEWKEVHHKELLCNSPPKTGEDSKPHHDNEDPDNEDPEEAPLKKETVRWNLPIVIVAVSVLLFFSLLMCCCTISTVKVAEDDDVISEMNQFAPLPRDEEKRDEHVIQYIDEDDDVMRRVQEQSRMEYESENAFTVGGQREALSQYMKAPIMTPEAYANYLSSTQPGQQ